MTKRRQKLLLVIADDHPVFLQGLADVFKSQSDIKIVAQCRDGTIVCAYHEYTQGERPIQQMCVTRFRV